jgi:glycosyltransferase involved in cell wall biosynthesis
MPCYNAADHIQDSIASVLNQTYQHFELIIVDDGSSDDSLAIVQREAEACNQIHVLSQQNRGAGPARNAALAVAKGTYVAFLDADDLWDSSFLEKMILRVRETGADLVYCGWQNTGLPGGRGEPYVPPDYTKLDLLEVFLKGCPWPIHAAVTSHEAIERVGCFNERWTSCMDYDLWLKLGTRIKIALLPEVLAYYRHYDGSQITKNAARIAKNHWLVQKDFLSSRPDVERKLGRKKIRSLTDGELLHRGYISYWRRDLTAARKIFRLVMKTGYGKPRDWMYMLPSILPLSIHTSLIRFLEQKS